MYYVYLFLFICDIISNEINLRGYIMILSDQKEKLDKIVGNLKIIADCL